MNEPRWHAERADELLAGIAQLSSQLEAMTREERDEAARLGALARANADLRWTAQLAVAHALTALALDGRLRR